MIGTNGKKMSERYEQNGNNILLIDSSTDLSQIKSITKTNNLKIITFDYQTHKNLEKLSINHIISDIFLDDKEKEKIQNRSYLYSQWYNESQIKEFVEYDGINLGSLSYIEFFVFMIPFLKKFVEIKKIFKQYEDSKFLASGLILNMIKEFTDNIQLLKNHNSDEDFIYDKVNFETNSFKIKLSKNNFLKLQKIFEKTTSIFLRNHNSLLENSIFLVEFNTILYQKLFLEIFDTKQNPVYLGVRRPPIWNKLSYSIIKKSHTQIASFSNISLQTKRIIDDKTKEIQNNWNSLLSHDDLLSNFFSYDGLSFWSLLKSYFTKLHDSRIKESIPIIEIAKNHFQKFKPKSILILSESGTTEQIIISLANKFHISTVLLQHGVGTFDSKKSDIINEFTGSMPIKSNKFVVWGDAMNKYCNQFGIPENKIHVLGSIAHEKIFENSLTENNSSDYVLLNPEPPGQTNINDYDVKTNQEYEDALRDVCKTIINLNKKLIIKIKPHIPERHETEIAKEVDASIKVIKSGDMSELVKRCSVFVTFGITSAMLDAAHFQKPIIRIRMREWWDSPDTLRPNSAISVYLDKFEITLKKLFSDNEYFHKTIENGNKFLDDCLINPNTVSDKIGSFLKVVE